MKRPAGCVACVFLLCFIVGLAAASEPTEPVTFRVGVPADTPNDEPVSLLFLSFQDWDWLEHVRMTEVEPNVWEATVRLHPGTLVRYAYDRWNETSWGEAWKETRETAGGGLRIEHRLLLVTQTTRAVRDTVAAWNDVPSTATTGTLQGIVVDAATGEPLPDTNLSCGGVHVASDFDGTFRFPPLPAGPQRVTAVRTLGDHRATTQETTIVVDAETDVRIEMSPTDLVSVTFEVDLPRDTPEGAEIQIAGSISQFGARIGAVNSLALPSINLPAFERDDLRASLTLPLYEGTVADYFYTIGSESHGREFDEEGRPGYRRLIVDRGRPVVHDSIAAWRPPDSVRLTVRATVPDFTPSGVPLAFSAGPSHWMTDVGERVWETYLHGYPGQEQPFDLRLGDQLSEKTAIPRVARFGEVDSVLEIEITQWQDAAAETPTWNGEPIPVQARMADFVAGFYPPDYWTSSFVPLLPSTFDAITTSNGTWVAISSIWSYGATSPTPVVESRPLLANSVLTPREDIVFQIALAHEHGLKALLAPQFNMEMTSGGVNEVCAAQTDAWWDAWLREAERLWMWNAQVAAEAGADALLLPGQCFHVFPHPWAFETEAGADRFDRALQELIARIREVYDGEILISGGTTEFAFPGLADWVGVTTYDTGHPDLPTGASVSEWRVAYDALFEETVDPLYRAWRKPVVFYTVHVPSRPTLQDPGGQMAQARQLEGLLQALAERPWVIGTFSWAYRLVAAPLAAADGVRGRIAERILSAYYEAFRGIRR